MAGRYLVWTGQVSTLLNDPANWDDYQDNLIPARSAPGTTDTAAFIAPVTLTGSIAVGTLSFSGAGAYLVNADITAGQATLLSSVTLGGTLAVSGAVSGNAPSLTLLAGAQLDATFGSFGTGNIVDAGTIAVNAGTLAIQTGISGTGALVVGGGASATTASVDLTGSLNIAGGGNFSAALGSLNAVTNNGTLQVLANSAAQNLALTGPLSGTGSLQIGFGARLELATQVSQNVTFAPAGPVQQAAAPGGASILQIDMPGSFTGTLTGFGAGDQIDLRGLQANQASLIGGTLYLSNQGAVVATLHLAGSYAGQAFALTPDGVGGVVLIDAGAPDPTASISLGNDSAGAGVAIEQSVAALVAQAASAWLRHMAGWDGIAIQYNITALTHGTVPDTTTPILTSDLIGPLRSDALGSNWYETATQGLMRSGLPAATPQITLTLNANMLSGMYLGLGAAVPSGQIDGLSVIEQALGHALGLLGYTTGTTASGAQTLFDQRLALTSTTAQFTGANAELLFGGPVPMQSGNGQPIIKLASGVVNPATGLPDLMTAIVPSGERLTISALDLAMLQDSGVPVISGLTDPPLTDPAFSQAHNDFLGSGRGGLLWQSSNGTVAVWDLKAGAMAGSAFVGQPGSFWHAVAGADLTGNGQADIVLESDGGGVAVWLLGAHGALVGGAVVANPGPAWQVVATGDLNGDGRSDLILQAGDGTVAAWEMNGARIIQGAVIANPGAAWHVRASGDFNGDGHADLVLQNNDGTIAVWQMNGPTITASAILGNPGPQWQVVGTADINGDGHSDILLQASGGPIAVWEMNGTRLGTTALIGDPGPYWRLRDVVDPTGSHQVSLILTSTEGTVAQWSLTGTAVTSSSVISDMGLSWQTIGTDGWHFISADYAATVAATSLNDWIDLRTPGAGGHAITGFNPARDLVALSAATYPSYAALAAAESNQGGGVSIPLGGGSSLTLAGIAPAQLSAHNFSLG